MKTSPLSFDAKKCLCVHMGEEAGEEIATLLADLAAQIDELRQTKVSITPITPTASVDGWEDEGNQRQRMPR